MKATALLLTLLSALPAAAQSATDSDVTTEPPRPRFQVVNGDTVKFGPQLVRLFGIDAPDRGQACDDEAWFPAPLARRALERFIAGRPVTCRQVDYDQKSNPPAAQCFAGDDDLQAKMVAAGWAWALVRTSDRYAPEERDAKAAKLGVHGHRCQPPWEWRAQQQRR